MSSPLPEPGGPGASPSEGPGRERDGELGGEPSVLRVLAAAGGALVLFLVAVVGVVAWAIGAFGAGSADAEPPRSSGPEAVPAPGAEVERPGEVVTRTERRVLEAELLAVEQELELARAQARSALSADERDGWAQRATELAEQRERLRQRLGR